VGSNHVELVREITAESVEWAYARACKAQRQHEEGIPETGMRAARNRDPLLLKCLERAAEVVTAMQESQIGRYRRDPGTQFSHTVELTEVSLWRQSYEFADKGEPLENFRWIYGAAAVLAGYCA
jgi:hypothetical protein|tara:strand:+ start:1599 stop:1970 length:372 start_codon:yes stop_codon:yes gene_type:complete